MNKVILVGNLTRDVELKYTQSGKPYARAGIAVNRPFSKNKEVDFFNLVIWDKLAEICDKYLHKGSKIVVEGRLQTSKYKDKDGTDRTSTEIIAENIEFADSRKGNSDNRREVSDYPPPDDEDTPF